MQLKGEPGGLCGFPEATGVSQEKKGDTLLWRQTHSRGSLVDSVDSVPDSSDVRAGHVRGGARLGYKASTIKI